jgi:hypothetical protein
MVSEINSHNNLLWYIMPWERLGAVMTEVADDYEHWRPPFSDQAGVTGPIVREIQGKPNKALFLTLSTALNRQRDAEGLYSKFGRLWETERWIFEPGRLIEDRTFEELAGLFEKEGVRFGETDAEVWYEISRTLYKDYNSDPMRLFERFDFNMERISDHVKNASGDTRFYDHGKKFPVLRGEKIRPLWLRLIDGYVHPLESQAGEEISVDTHIIQITNKLFDKEYSDGLSDKEEIRDLWRSVCEDESVNPIDIDGALWYINRGWDDWGREYLSEKYNKTSANDVEPTQFAANLEPDLGETDTNDADEETASTTVAESQVPHEVFNPHDGVMKRTAMKIGTARYFVDAADLDIDVMLTDAPHHLSDGQVLAITPDELDQSSWTQWTIYQFRLILAATAMEPNGLRHLNPEEVDTKRYFELEREYWPALIEARDLLSASTGEGMNKKLRDAGYHPEQITPSSKKPESAEK